MTAALWAIGGLICFVAGVNWVLMVVDRTDHWSDIATVNLAVWPFIGCIVAAGFCIDHAMNIIP
jgi:hypothetical protein